MNAVKESRPERAEVTSTRRRRRRGGVQQGKLMIPQEVKSKHPDMEFRWGIDSEGRMEQLTQNDDWESVPKVEPIHAGVNSAGDAVKHHLLMKPKEFMIADQKEKLERIDSMEAAELSAPEKQEAIATGSDVYQVPGNKI